MHRSGRCDAAVSKTARPRPGHHEAGRHGRHLSLLPEAGGRFADDFVKRTTERAEAAETDVEADVGDAAVRRSQQEHRPLDAPALQVAVGRLAERVTEGANEVRLRHLSDPSKARNAEWLGERAIHRVSCAQHPAIAFFDRSRHLLFRQLPPTGEQLFDDSGSFLPQS